MAAFQSLDDFYYFAKVVEHGGYAKAARALQIPKSRLSRHVAALEGRLNVRLVNRSTRRFAITDVGQEVRRHALAMLAEADAAFEAVEFVRAEPRGTVRLSCPVAMAQRVMPRIIPDFLRRYPSIRVLLEATNRRVDVINEGFDLSLRVRSKPSGEDGLIMRTFAQSRQLLVANSDYLTRHGRPERPERLVEHATLDFALIAEALVWELSNSSGETVRVEHLPRLVCHDFELLRAAVVDGVGIALLPETVVRADLDAGKLEAVLPDWTLPLGILHLVFPTRRGLLPSVRALIDFLAERIPGFV